MATKFEYNNTASTDTGPYGANWEGQTFTPVVSHKIILIKLRVYRNGSPGTVTVSIRATTDGLPTGADLASGTFNGNAITTATAGEIVEITLSASVALIAGTVYAIVFRAPSGDASNWLGAKVSTTPADPNPYARGQSVTSTDSGGTWGVYDGSLDYWFEEWGIVGGGSLWVEGLKLRYTDGTNDTEQATKYEGEQETF